MSLVQIASVVLVAVILVGLLLPDVPLWLLALIALIGLAGLLFAAKSAGSARSSDGKRSDGEVTCDACHAQFSYYLIHNGFNDSAYAYCDTCGQTALLSGWAGNIPKDVDLRIHQPIAPELEEHLAACSCGGRFRAHASPRCPHCRHPLAAASLTHQIEENAPGTKGGWRWQQDWSGLYAIVIEDRMTRDNWVTRAPESDA